MEKLERNNCLLFIFINFKKYSFICCLNKIMDSSIYLCSLYHSNSSGNLIKALNCKRQRMFVPYFLQNNAD